ncbi:MAG: response regulator [Planctomycetota bacterium]
MAQQGSVISTISRPVAKPRMESVPNQPRRILVGDDEYMVATGLANMLKDLGFQVIGPATNGRSAIELCQTEQPDLALLDIRMPEVDGLEAAEHLFKALGVPVVIFSAYSTPEYVAGGTAAGVFGYLLKPVDQDQLRAGISVAWGRYSDYVNRNSEIFQLKQRLEDRKLIEQAKWIIVERKQLSEPDAMKTLQRQARNNRRPLVEVARSVIENADLFAN